MSSLMKPKRVAEFKESEDVLGKEIEESTVHKRGRRKSSVNNEETLNHKQHIPS